MKLSRAIFLILPCMICLWGSIFSQNRSENLDTSFVNTENRVARKYYIVDDYDSLYIWAIKALAHSNDLGYNQGKAQAELSLADYYQVKSRFDKSLSYLLSAKKLFEKEKDLQGLAKSETQIGVLYYLQKNYKTAGNYFEKSLAHTGKTDIDFGTRHYLAGLSMTEAGRLNEAEQHLITAKRTYDSLGIKKNSNEALVGLGDLYVKRKEYRKAEEFYNQALTWLSTDGYEEEGIAICHLGLGNVKSETGQKDEAIKLISRAYQLADSVGFYIVSEKAALQLSKLYRDKQDFRQAYKYQDRYFAIRDSIMSADNLKAINSMESELELSKKQSELALMSKQRQVARLTIYSTLGGVLLLLLISLILYQRFLYERKTKNTITKEKQHSDDLLLNILPEETAAELKEHGKAQAKQYSEVTVLFADIQGFTTHAESLSPEELVSLVDRYFQGFDEIVEKCGMEKIKTIGDAYLCAGGLPNPDKGKPADAVRCALEMQGFVRQMHERKEGPFEIRIGIHTGPVVAGVVGTRKFAYDIWGDTVNTAARMEQNSEAGKVNISQSTYEHVKGLFTCIYRGRISAKNKGEIDMYFVEKEMSSAA